MYRAISAATARQREYEQSPAGKCNSVYHGKRLQVEGIAEILWKVAYCLRTHEPLEQKWRLAEAFRGIADRGSHQDQDGKCLPGQHDGQSASKWHRCVKKTGKQSIGRSRGGLTTKIHMVTASDRSPVAFSLSGGNTHDGPEGELLVGSLKRLEEQRFMLMDRAYAGDSMRMKVVEKGFIPIVPPKRNRRKPWDYDKEHYKQRNEIERYFLRIKRFRKIFTRYDKLDVMFCGFIYFAIIADALLSVNRL